MEARVLGLAGALLLTIILYVVGFSSPWWQWDSADHWGLWLVCGRHCYPLVGKSVIHVSRYHRATQVLQCLCLGGAAVALVCVGVWTALVLKGASGTGACRARQAASLSAFTAGVLDLAGLLVFGSEQLQVYKAPRGYGFWLCAVACACFITVAIVMHILFTPRWGRRKKPLTDSNGESAGDGINDSPTKTIELNNQD